MNLKKFSKLIMIEQTAFALPFAWIGILFAGGGKPVEWIWITIALISARTAGMSFNRAQDSEIDAKNPRTENRLIPSGEVSKKSVWIIGTISSLLLIISSFMLNDLVFYLSFIAIILLFTYSLFKRFSSSSHFYLGFVEAAAPIGGYLAISGNFDILAFIPGTAIMFWIAGLDIIYSIQDLSFDKEEGLFSIPAKFGKEKALVISLVSYIFAESSLILAGIISGMTNAYWLGIIIISFLFAKQQLLVRKKEGKFEDDIIEVFKINRFVSPAIFIASLIDVLVRNIY